MKNAEGFKFMSYERSNHFAGHTNAARAGFPAYAGKHHNYKELQPWSQLGAAEADTNQKDRTKSNHLGGGSKPQTKYRPKQPF